MKNNKNLSDQEILNIKFKCTVCVNCGKAMRW